MSKGVTTAKGNRYCQARLEAAKYNPDYLNRTTTVQHLPGVTEDCLKKYELDLSNPPNTVIALMADAYAQPELKKWYCVNKCPLGGDCREIGDMPPERALLRLQNAVKDIDKAMEALSQIMEDGIISDNEKPMIPVIKDTFLEARRRVDENLALLEKAEVHGNFND